jgi:C4-dicarboxylate transporter, DctM subunit
VALKGDFGIAANLLSIAARDSIATFEFGVVPLFVLMGIAVSAAGIGRDAYILSNALLGRIRGGIGHATVAANTVFAAVTGVSIASATVFSRIAVPEMLRAGYSPRLAVGIVAGSSMLGMLIPPSLLLIMMGVLTDLSIGRLFIAGVLPGLLMALCFSATIYVIAVLRPQAAGVKGVAENQLKLRIWDMLRLATPLVGLMLAVLGGIYSGVFTPTEAGAVGAALALIVAAVRGRVTLASIWSMIVETGQVTASICILVIAATMYSRFLALSGASNVITHAMNAGGFGLFGTLTIFVLILLFLGAFMESLSILLLTVPVAYPIFMSLGADPYWFCIIVVIVVEIGLVTPPLGMTAFVIKSSLDEQKISLNDIYMGSLPFIAAMLACTLLIALFPQIVTLPITGWK